MKNTPSRPVENVRPFTLGTSRGAAETFADHIPSSALRLNSTTSLFCQGGEALAVQAPAARAACAALGSASRARKVRKA
jgi:hypothetical protein